MSPVHRPSSPSSSRPSAPSPLPSSSHLSRYSSSLTSGITKGLASLAGTAATAAGGVGALTGLTGRNEVVGDDPTEEPKPEREGRYGVRAAVGGWLGSGRKKGTFVTQDRLLLFPGWAVKRPTEDGGVDDALETGAQILDSNRPDPKAIEPFEIHLHLSGFCTTLRPPEAATMYSRLFSKMARQIANLPDLPQDRSRSSTSSTIPNTHPDRDATVTNRQLSTSPQEVDQAKEGASYFGGDAVEGVPSMEPLDLNDPAEPVRARPSSSTLANHRTPSRTGSLPPVLDRAAAPTTLSSGASTSSSPYSRQGTATGTLQSMQTDLLQLHLNLQQRMQPFFSSVIPGRNIKLEIRPRLRNPPPSTEPARAESPLPPLLSMTVTTNLNGSFTETIKIPWDTIVESPECLEMIFPEKRKNAKGVHVSGRGEEWVLEVTAMLMSQTGEGVVMESGSYPERPTSTPLTGEGSGASTAAPTPAPSVPLTAKTLTPLSNPTGIRVISDLDDTVKRTDLMAGLREVFRNVFCRSVGELEVPGMGSLYRSLVGDGSGGVQGWHYVSNSPYELFDPIHSFLTTHEFPPGFSLRLKFYGGKSTFKGIWEPAGEKKMAGVLEILDGFPQSRFILFGDSAEQDLDLYSSLAMQRPKQIAGIFIRDVSALAPPVRSGTGSSTMASSSTSSSSLSSSQSSPPGSPTLGPTEVANGPGRVHRIASSLRPDFTRSASSSSNLQASASSSGTATPSIASSKRSGRSRKSSISSLLYLRGEGDPSTDALSPNNPLPDLAIANAMLASSSSSPSLPPAPPTVSEDDTHQMESAPVSPKMTAQMAEHPEEAAEEAMTSARIKALKAADAFRGRFEKAKRELEPKGVVVVRFREVADVEERVRALVFGEGK